MSIARHYTQKGFTMLEVMVALAILAVAAAGLLSATSQSFGRARRLEDKTMAIWLAQNQLEEMRAARTWPETGESDQAASMGGRDWNMHIRVSPLSDPGMRKVEIAVYARQGDRDSLTSLTGFLGRN